ncbi:MAG: tetratricopeptide repeat protein [Paracoccaceae bacterium]
MRRAWIGAALLAMAALPATAQTAGAYLAGRAAAQDGAFEVAAEAYLTAIGLERRGALNQGMSESALAALVGMGDHGRADALARSLLDAGDGDPQLALISVQVAAADAGDWDAVLAGVEAGPSVGPLVDGLTRGWAHIGQGRVDEALSAFDALTPGGLRGFALYHRALALSVAGRPTEALAILTSPPEDGLQRTRRSVVLHAAVLAELDHTDEAARSLRAAFGRTPPADIARLLAALDAGATPDWHLPTTAREGLGEAYFSVAGALKGQTRDAYTLLYARMAQRLAPRNAQNALLTAELLGNLGRDDLATAALRAVGAEHPAAPLAALARADLLLDAGQAAAAAELLAPHAPTHPRLMSRLGDARMGSDDPRAAVDAYDAALARLSGSRAAWSILHARARAQTSMGNWLAAQSDLRAALDLRPDDPHLASDLGHAMVAGAADAPSPEALDLLAAAHAGAPEDGGIAGTYGWALLSGGEVAAAVALLERAATLRPADPAINEHLGDAYWTSGRRDEARFQWRRAILFADPAAHAGLSVKIEHGLPDVLADATPTD